MCVRVYVWYICVSLCVALSCVCGVCVCCVRVCGCVAPVYNKRHIRIYVHHLTLNTTQHTKAQSHCIHVQTSNQLLTCNWSSQYCIASLFWACRKWVELGVITWNIPLPQFSASTRSWALQMSICLQQTEHAEHAPGMIAPACLRTSQEHTACEKARQQGNRGSSHSS